MDRTRRNARIIALISGVVVCACAWGIATRIARFHEENPPRTWAFMRVSDPRFTFAGRLVLIQDDVGAANPGIVVRYGEDQLPLRTTVPGAAGLPIMLREENWMRVLVFTEATGRTVHDIEADLAQNPDNYRLVIVTRTPRAGVNPETWGLAWKRDWSFDFYEFLPEGGFSREHLKYPARGGIRRPRPGELTENTWQFQAALQMMPQPGGIGPTRNFFGDALTAAGWLLPAAAFSGLAFTLAAAFSFAPIRRRG